jgi:hypothetical protein
MSLTSDWPGEHGSSLRYCSKEREREDKNEPTCRKVNKPAKKKKQNQRPLFAFYVACHILNVADVTRMHIHIFFVINHG